MKRERIQELIKSNREIEFEYRNHRYSITYFNEECEKPISFCEFYRKPINVRNPDELLNITVDSRTLEDIFAELPDSAFDIY